MAALLGEPWCLPLGRVARLTLRQIYTLYLHPRDDHGRVKLPGRTPEAADTPEPERGSQEEATIYFLACQDFGMSREVAEAQWAATGREMPGGLWYESIWAGKGG